MYLRKETKQTYYQLRLVGEKIDDTFQRIAKMAELIRTKSVPNEDPSNTTKKLIAALDFQNKTISLLEPLQQPNETILDTLRRILNRPQETLEKSSTPKNLKQPEPFTSRTVI